MNSAVFLYEVTGVEGPDDAHNTMEIKADGWGITFYVHYDEEREAGVIDTIQQMIDALEEMKGNAGSVTI